MQYELQTTEHFEKWLSKIKDASVRIKILARLDRVENGNFGDFKQVGGDLFELRFFFGAGLRVYFTIKAGAVVILLAAGDKSSQARDIKKAAEILGQLED